MSWLSVFFKWVLESLPKSIRVPLIVIVSIIASVLITSIGVKNYIDEKVLPAIATEQGIDDIIFESSIISRIDEMLLKNGLNNFCCVIRYESRLDQDRLAFKDVRGYTKDYPIPISLKNRNPVFEEVHQIDKNSSLFIRGVAPLVVESLSISKAQHLGLSSIVDIIKRQNTTIDKFKYIIVRDKESVIWVFTHSFIDDKKFYSNEEDEDLLNIAIMAQAHINRLKSNVIIKLVDKASI